MACDYCGKITKDLDSSPSVCFESGRQESDKEWRQKIYKDGGSQIIKEILNHYKPEHVIELITNIKPQGVDVDFLKGELTADAMMLISSQEKTIPHDIVLMVLDTLMKRGHLIHVEGLESEETVKPQYGEWLPIDKNTPKGIEVDVWVKFEHGERRVCNAFLGDCWQLGKLGQDQYIVWPEVLAWMPLPDAPKEGE